MQNIKNFLANLSSEPGVYQMLDKQARVIYVGKAKNLKNRVSSYFSGTAKDPKTQLLLKNIDDIQITVTRTENEAVLLECNLIKKYHPRFNVLLRDDKSYPYIHITDHDYPRIVIYRGAKKKKGQFFGPYPNSLAVRETISLLQKIFRLRTCRDSFFKGRSRPCLLYQIGRCSGPCVELIDKKEYAASVKLATLFLEGKSSQVLDLLTERMQQAASKKNYELAAEYRDQIVRLKDIQEKQYVSVQSGDADVIGVAIQAGVAAIHVLSIRDGQITTSRSFFPKAPEYIDEKEILSAFLKQHYLDQVGAAVIPRLLVVSHAFVDQELLTTVMSEQAERKVRIIIPARGEKLKWLQIALSSVKQALATHLYTKINMHARLEALQKALSLLKAPRRIECFDISHSSGEATVASCVVFDANGPLKSDYRRFNIKDITPGDDVAAIFQVITRRFKLAGKEGAVLPDLVLIDGGKAQLEAARRAAAGLEDAGVVMMGVSKGPGRKAGFETLHRHGCPPMHLPADSLALHLIQHIRDEAHRFAITGHRGRRDKARVKSVLEDIPGVGPKKRRELLRYFGGIKGVARASLDELLKVPGINKSLAEAIVALFNEKTD